MRGIATTELAAAGALLSVVLQRPSRKAPPSGGATRRFSTDLPAAAAPGSRSADGECEIDEHDGKDEDDDEGGEGGSEYRRGVLMNQGGDDGGGGGGGLGRARGFSHVPVMLKEVLQFLQPHRGELFIDGTFGAGGYSRAILLASQANNARLVALDRDPSAFRRAQKLGDAEGEELFRGRVTPVLGRFGDLLALCADRGVRAGTVDGVVFDLGMSSMQVDDTARGFNFRADAPLDMRMAHVSGDELSDRHGVTAADIVNDFQFESLRRIFERAGDRKSARVIANAIIDYREQHAAANGGSSSGGKIVRTKQLADIVSRALATSGALGRKSQNNKGAGGETAVGYPVPGGQTNLATQCFMGLRMYVNEELNELENGLRYALQLLKPGGRLVVVSFHSGEDALVKRVLRKSREADVNAENLGIVQYSEAEAAARIGILTRKAVVPSLEEVHRNPRARSALLRAAVKVR